MADTKIMSRSGISLSCSSNSKADKGLQLQEPSSDLPRRVAVPRFDDFHPFQVRFETALEDA